MRAIYGYIGTTSSLVSYHQTCGKTIILNLEMRVVIYQIRFIIIYSNQAVKLMHINFNCEIWIKYESYFLNISVFCLLQL